MSFNPLVDQLAIDVKTAARRRGPSCFPKIGDYRLTRRQPFQSVHRHWKTFGADVFAKGEKRVMSSADNRSSILPLIDLDLFNAWIALDVKNAIGSEQIVVEFLRAADVQDRVCFSIELSNSF